MRKVIGRASGWLWEPIFDASRSFGCRGLRLPLPFSLGRDRKTLVDVVARKASCAAVLMLKATLVAEIDVMAATRGARRSRLPAGSETE